MVQEALARSKGHGTAIANQQRGFPCVLPTALADGFPLMANETTAWINWKHC